MALDTNKPDKTDDRKKKFLKELELSRGIITTAAQNAGIHRSTYYDWYDADPEFKADVEAINESCIDWVESKLHEKINGVLISGGVTKDGDDIVYSQPPSDTAIIFYLKTKAKKRGYVERTDIALMDPDGNAIPPPTINIIMKEKDNS